MNNASRIIEAQRERESSLAGGEAARGQGAFERGNGREVQTVNTTRPRLCPPRPLFVPSTGPPSSVYSLEPCVLSQASRWVGGCLVLGSAGVRSWRRSCTAAPDVGSPGTEQRRGTAVDRQPVAPYTPTHTESPVPVSCGASLLRLRTK